MITFNTDYIFVFFIKTKYFEVGTIIALSGAVNDDVCRYLKS